MKNYMPLTIRQEAFLNLLPEKFTSSDAIRIAKENNFKPRYFETVRRKKKFAEKIKRYDHGVYIKITSSDIHHA